MDSYDKNNPQTISKMFYSIAKEYDRANAVLSLQMHKRWNQALIKETLKAVHPKTLLDLCCGTGAIAFEFLKQEKAPLKAYLLDFSEGMLQCARERAQSMRLDRHDIIYLKADAQQIPLLENSVDCVTMAYGIRNVKNPEICLRDVYRVLAPGGTLGILELTQPKNPLLRLGHRLYLKTVLPIVGRMLTSNREAYQYLGGSILSFIPPAELEKLMQQVGFKEVRKKSLFGGVATLLIGKKK